jgi:hypothetical protein
MLDQVQVLKFIIELLVPEEVRNIKDLNWTPFNGDGSEDTNSYTC